MSVSVESRSRTVETVVEPVQEGSKEEVKSKKDGRSYSDISKKIGKIVLITAAVVVGLLATAALVAGLFPLVMEGASAVVIVAAFKSAGAAVGVFGGKVVAFLVTHSTWTIVLSSAALVSLGGGAAVAVLVPKCKKNNQVSTKSEHSVESDERVSRSSSEGEDDGITEVRTTGDAPKSAPKSKKKATD